MATINETTGELVMDDVQSPMVNADAAVVVGTPVLLESGKWKTFILKDGQLYLGKFACDDVIEKGDVVLVKFKDASSSVRGKLKKIA